MKPSRNLVGNCRVIDGFLTGSCRYHKRMGVHTMPMRYCNVLASLTVGSECTRSGCGVLPWVIRASAVPCNPSADPLPFPRLPYGRLGVHPPCSASCRVHPSPFPRLPYGRLGVHPPCSAPCPASCSRENSRLRP